MFHMNGITFSMVAPSINTSRMCLGETWLRSFPVSLSLQTQPNWDQKGQGTGRQKDRILCHCQFHFLGDPVIHEAFIWGSQSTSSMPGSWGTRKQQKPAYSFANVYLKHTVLKRAEHRALLSQCLRQMWGKMIQMQNIPIKDLVLFNKAAHTNWLIYTWHTGSIK